MVHIHCNCRDCGSQLDLVEQARSPRVGGYMQLVTCWNKACLLYGVTREINTYLEMSEADLESYREMNRKNQANA